MPIPTIHNKKLTRKQKPASKYLLLLTNQTVIIGYEFDVMRVYRKKFSDKKVDDMRPTKKRVDTENGFGYRYYNREGESFINLQGPVFITTLSDLI